MILTTQSSSHFYAYKDGQFVSCHEVPYADGKGMRKTTLTDARRLNLFPSVTGICSIVNEPGLNNYWKTQAIMSALTLPRGQEDILYYVNRCIIELGAGANDAGQVAEWCYRNQPRPVLTDDEHAQLVVKDMEAHSEAAKKLGSEIHDAISSFLKRSQESQEYDCSAEAAKLTEPIFNWITENVTEIHALEQIVGSLEHGYVGTLDLDADIKGIGRAIIDYKTQNVKRNGKGPKPEFYFSYGKQLAAYGQAVYDEGNAFHFHHTGPGERKLVSIIIDKANAGEVFVKIWDNPDELWRQFLNNCESWRFENSYDPRGIL